MKPIDQISSDVVGEAIRIHRELGPGLLESVCQAIADLPASDQAALWAAFEFFRREDEGRHS